LIRGGKAQQQGFPEGVHHPEPTHRPSNEREGVFVSPLMGMVHKSWRTVPDAHV
jgi:hypothetical protein